MNLLNPTARRTMALVLTAALLTGCSGSGPYIVGMNRLKVATAPEKKRADELRRIYLYVISDAKGNEKRFWDEYIGPKKNYAETEGWESFPYSAVVPELNRVLNTYGANIVAYRIVSEKPKNDPYLADIKPSAIGVLRYPPLHIKASVTRTDRKTKKGEALYDTKTESKWALHLSIDSYPSGRALLNQSESFRKVYENESMAGFTTSDGFAASDFSEDAAKRIAKKLTSTTWESGERYVWRYSAAPASVQALAAYAKQDYQQALDLWKGQCDSPTVSSTTWQDCYNAGAWSEKRADLAGAVRYYQKAQKLQAGYPTTYPIDWAPLVNPSAHLIVPFINKDDRDAPYFQRETAVLPFSDSTASFQGPISLRTMMYAMFVAAGYNMMPLEEVDKRLREKGYTQAGQFRRVKRGEIIDWLKAERMIEGDVSSFDDIKTGLVTVRKVAGDFAWWDRRDKNSPLFSMPLSVGGAVIVPTIDPVILGAVFAVTLLLSYAEILMKQPLSAESYELVQRFMKDLPRGFKDPNQTPFTLPSMPQGKRVEIGFGDKGMKVQDKQERYE